MISSWIFWACTLSLELFLDGVRGFYFQAKLVKATLDFYREKAWRGRALRWWPISRHILFRASFTVHPFSAWVKLDSEILFTFCCCLTGYCSQFPKGEGEGHSLCQWSSALGSRECWKNQLGKGWLFLMEDSKDESQFFNWQFYGQNSIKWFQDQVEEAFLCSIFKDQEFGVGWVLLSS